MASQDDCTQREVEVQIREEAPSLCVIVNTFESINTALCIDSVSSALSPCDLLEQASGGLALAGVLLGNDIADLTVARRMVLQPPRDIKLRDAYSDVKHEVIEFSSRIQKDSFNQLLDSIGHSVATNVKAGKLGVKIGTGFVKSSAEQETSSAEEHGDEVFISKERYFYVPTASCELDANKSKLAEGFRIELERLENILTSANDAAVQERCELLLKQYGSHVVSGMIEFGGIFKWQATHSCHSSSSKEAMSRMVNDALEGFMSNSMKAGIFKVKASSEAERDQERASEGSSQEELAISNVDFKATKKGGPKQDMSLSSWKDGLLAHNTTWAVIDRGRSVEGDFIGIWDVLRNGQTGLKNPRDLADALEKTWHTMHNVELSGFTNSSKVENALHAMNKKLDYVPKWKKDPNLFKMAPQYLQILLTAVKKCCTDTGDGKVWAKILENDERVSDFLSHIINMKDEFSHNKLANIQFTIKKLVETTGKYDFPLKNEMKLWINIPKPNSEVFYMIKGTSIDDIPNLIATMKGRLVPRMEAAKDTAAEKVQREATSDLAVAVDHLRNRPDQDKVGLSLLLVALTNLGYDVEQKGFNKPVKAKNLKRFTKSFENDWKEYIVHKQSGEKTRQTFVLNYLVKYVGRISESKRKEQLFLRHLDVMKQELCPELTSEIEKHTTTHPFHWNGLSNSLGKIMHGENPDDAEVHIDWLGNIGDNDETDSMQGDNPKEDAHEENQIDILQKLGLVKYFPSKISLREVTALRKENVGNKSEMHDVAWMILQKLVMLDYKARESEIQKYINQQDNNDGGTEEEETSGDFFRDLGLDTSLGETTVTLNPLDVFVAVYACCDMLLQQIIVQKMFMCRLAVPFICPSLYNGAPILSIWALRKIIIEWKSSAQVCCERSVVKQPAKTVSCIRLGRPSCSKSRLLNSIMSDQSHHVFWNRDCPLADSPLSVANGLVEAQWYLPSGDAQDVFADVTMFLNLRGNALENLNQMEMLSKISNIVVCCVESSDLKDTNILEVLDSLQQGPSKVLLYLTMKTPSQEELRKDTIKLYDHLKENKISQIKMVSSIKSTKEKSSIELQKEVRKNISELLKLQTGKVPEEAAGMANAFGISVDEDNPHCLQAKRAAENVIACLDGKPPCDFKDQHLPLQGEFWKRWTECLKDKETAEAMDSDVVQSRAIIKREMKHLRRKQFERSLKPTPFFQNFLNYLYKLIDTLAVLFFLQWMRLFLDERSRETLPELHRQYHEKWKRIKAVKNDPKEEQVLRKSLEETEKKLAGASLGVEHLMREIAQFYESAFDSETKMDQATEARLRELPIHAAKLLLNGQPLEIMDGDVANVPLIWVEALFSSLRKLIGNKKLFAISVLGIQSSGKSTLLNTMFGLQFAVSAGRCTRGVYMQLLPVDKSNGKLSCDYVLIIDTEGLRAPELSHLKHDNDNKLATFAIGLGDVTVLNIKGENVSDITDVLQIAVHAFLRMRLTNKFQVQRSCIFIHQNVSAINAKSKMQQGCKALEEKLDLMTAEASKLENIMDAYTFKDIIEFDSEDNVWHFADLWHGNPPMAPVNPGYTSKVQEVKSFLLNKLVQKQHTLLTVADMSIRIEDLWKGVLSENFVFSFRNCLEAKAYASVESKYLEKRWKAENDITKWLTGSASTAVIRCGNGEDLENKRTELQKKLVEKTKTVRKEVCTELESFFKNHNLQDIVIEWKSRKMHMLEEDVSSIERRTQRQLEKRIDLAKHQLESNTKFAELNQRIMRKAQEFANDNKSPDAEEDQCKKKFESFWLKITHGIVAETNEEPIEIVTIVENILLNCLKQYHQHLTQELEVKPLVNWECGVTLIGSYKEAHIQDTDISATKSKWKNLKSQFTGKDYSIILIEEALTIVQKIFEDVEPYLSDLKNGEADFHDTYATDVIMKVKQAIETHNDNAQKTGSLTLLPKLKVEIVVHVCRYAVTIFNFIRENYMNKHSIKAKLEEKKQDAWCVFWNTVKNTAEEVTAADLLINHLQDTVKAAVHVEISHGVVDQVLHDLDFKKTTLLIRLLKDLLHTDSFFQYHLFLSQPKVYAESWMRSYVDRLLFDTHAGQGVSKYNVMAKDFIDRFVCSIKTAIDETTEHITEHQGSGDLEEWINVFAEMLDDLPICTYTLQSVSEKRIEDFEHLQELLIRRLGRFEENLVEYFNVTERARSIHYTDISPYKAVLNNLWGCEVQCPFCGEMCMRASQNHEGIDHECIQHRPSIVKGVRWKRFLKLFTVGKYGKLAIEPCNKTVQNKHLKFTCSSCNYECHRSGNCKGYQSDKDVSHPCTEYKTYLPDWDIPPSSENEGSLYWMRFVARFKKDLESIHGRPLPQLPDEWYEITKKEAENSLDQQVTSDDSESHEPFNTDKRLRAYLCEHDGSESDSDSDY